MKHVLRILAVIGTFLGTFILAVCIAVVIIMKGPSHSAAELFTLSLKETSALKWIPDIFFSDEEIQQIIDNNSVKGTDETTNTDLIDTTDTASQDIEIYEISGPTYIGDVMLIKDPSRLFVGNKGPYDGSGGTTVDVIAARYDAVAGINGGGFYDAGGMGNGGVPDGFVISEGEYCYGDRYTPYAAIGFTPDNKMVIGTFTGQDAVDMGLRDCVCVQTVYAPVLILNGEEQEVAGVGGGLNPRTAIGQRADGSVLLLVVDGRQADSLGATFKDLAYIMLEYGAVNACAMDGGTSSQMVYNGEILNHPYSPTGPRKCPTAWLVR